MENKFTLHHTALYAKGWYKQYQNHPSSPRKTIYDDLRKTLSKDDYSGDIMTERDILYVILHQLEQLDIQQFKPTTLLSEINEYNCWKYGYETKKNSFRGTIDKDYLSKLPYYDLNMAILFYCLSCIKLMNKEKLGWDENKPFPDYKNCLPKPRNIKQKQYELIFQKSEI